MSFAFTQRSTIPAFSFSKTEWDRLLKTAPAGTVVVLDIGIGEIDPNLTNPPGDEAKARVQAAHGANLLVLGYVPTCMAFGVVNANPPIQSCPGKDGKPLAWRTVQAINTYVDRWYALPLDGIFFDEGPDPESFEKQGINPFPHPPVHAFYQAIFDHVKGVTAPGGKLVMLNDAVLAGNAWSATANDALDHMNWVMQTSDIVVSWEADADAFEANYNNRAWLANFPPERFAHVVHTCKDPPAETGRRMARIVEKSKQHGAGFVFVYDGTSNAYDHLPPYWDLEVPWVGTRLCVVPHLPHGRADFGVWRISEGNWYVKRSSEGAESIRQWGVSGDVPVPGDYDGDTRNDLAVWRPNGANWWIVDSSTGTSRAPQWGQPGDVPVPGDYDGDGITDLAIWRPSEGNWYIIHSSNGTPQAPVHLGLPGDIPVPGDYDGDHKTDLAVWRPSEGNWYVIHSSNGPQAPVQWGLPGDIPAPGDYDNDGKTDFAVWRPMEGLFYIISSKSGAESWWEFGCAFGDIPVPGDYDGDGKTELAVWRIKDGTWIMFNIVLASFTGTLTAQQWGAPGDIPVPLTSGPPLLLDVQVTAQGKGTGTSRWAIVTATDAATGQTRDGNVTIHGARGTTGHKLTYQACFEIENRIKYEIPCDGTVVVPNYPPAGFQT
jgi:hypothetical protein